MSSPQAKRRSPSPKSRSKKPVSRRGQGKFIKSVEPLRNGQDLKITFQGEEMDPSFINALRRVLLAEIGTYSLSDNLTILSNTSTAFKNNEYVVDRFAQIPIFVKDLKKTPFLDRKVYFYICAQGDPDHPLVNDNDQDLLINAHDLQLFDDQKNPLKFAIDELIPLNQPILKLLKGEEFHFRGEIARGVGHYNGTFKSCRVSYKYENEVSLDSKASGPKSPITGKPIETLEDKRNYPKDRWGNPQFISLTLKPVGHYDPDVCFKLALEVLEQKLLMLQNLVGNPRHYTTTKLEIIPDTNIKNRLLVKIQDLQKTEEFLASHTIAELVAKHMYYKLYDLVGGNLEQIRESMTSCRRMHRLDPIILLDIKTPPGLYSGSDDPPIQLLNEAIESLLDYVNVLKKDFKV